MRDVLQNIGSELKICMTKKSQLCLTNKGILHLIFISTYIEEPKILLAMTKQKD